MQNNIDRAKDLLPSIILTILSMIQALALELFWSKIEGSSFLWQPGLEAIVGWLQLLVMLFGILLIWVFYVSFVLRFTWLPALEDTLIPFVIGLLEFAMIDLMRPNFIGLWFVLLAAVFAVVTAASHLTMRQARRDSSNDYFFRNMGPAGWRDYMATIIVVTLFCGFGLVLWLCDNNRLMSIAALLIALAAMSYQMIQAKRYWMHSLQPE
ncbi:MAG: hypothetical protein V7700_05545 [Halioglobus sp.]